MEVIVLPTAEAACLRAARIVARILRGKPDAALALPTGSTPRGIYAELSRLHREEGLSFARASAFSLDEYVGIPPDHPGAFRRALEEALYRQVDLPAARVHAPDGQAADLPAACARYEAEIAAAGGLDLALLGLGTDGHVAFNEPTSSLGSRTRLKTLAEETRAANQPAFGGAPVPHHALTVGIATILEARRCLLVAFGGAKAAAVAKLIEGPLTAFVPASALQLHPHATVIVDEAAADGLRLRAYYDAVAAAKPAWQREA
ncbi:MAG TPA: glucosamine-6-phosphate deaminase [Polyangia bacterium]|nr:glucosamine-6-phosphate deaminase [Polyangia bacterium]